MIMQKLFGEFVDVIEWTDPSTDTLAWRFERYNNEIKFGAKLTVREGQTAVFVNEGEIADVFTPGMYELRTANLPILSTLQGWRHGFESPFKAEIYFFSMRRFPDLKAADGEFEEAHMQIQPPLDPKFRVGNLGLAYDDERDLVCVIARELQGGEPQENEEVSGLVARFWCTRDQLAALARWGVVVAERGRPVCPQCQQPMEP